MPGSTSEIRQDYFGPGSGSYLKINSIEASPEYRALIHFEAEK